MEDAGLRASWTRLADALLAQRVLLHLEDGRRAVRDRSATVGGLDDARVLAQASVGPPPAGRFAPAGLTFFVALPARHGDRSGAGNPLVEASGAAVAGITELAPSLAGPLDQLARASAWWVGFFGLIRHQGVHHTTLEPVRDGLELPTLREAAGVVSLGVALRYAEALLHGRGGGNGGAGGGGGVERAYCLATSRAVEAERGMPALLARLGELRLVDLVTLCLPWHGQFAAFRGGAGPGQGA